MGEGAARYTRESYHNDLGLRVRVVNLEDSEKRKSVFGDGIELGISFTRDCFAYLNQDAGWVYADGGTRRALENVRALGGTVISGKEVRQLVRGDGGTGRTTGVKCKDGSAYSAELVVLATGSWTPSTFPELTLQCLATGFAYRVYFFCTSVDSLSQAQYRNHPAIFRRGGPVSKGSGGVQPYDGILCIPGERFANGCECMITDPHLSQMPRTWSRWPSTAVVMSGMFNPCSTARSLHLALS